MIPIHRTVFKDYIQIVAEIPLTVDYFRLRLLKRILRDWKFKLLISSSSVIKVQSFSNYTGLIGYFRLSFKLFRPELEDRIVEYIKAVETGVDWTVLRRPDPVELSEKLEGGTVV